MRTTFSLENEKSSVPDTVLTQNNLENGDGDMAKWPKRVKHRNKVLAKIYQPCRGRDSYRVTWYAAGRRQMKSLPTYAGKGGAKAFAEALVNELAKNSQAFMLTPAQASDALAAIERLVTFHQTTGRKVSLLAAVSDYCESVAKTIDQWRLRVASPPQAVSIRMCDFETGSTPVQFLSLVEKFGNGRCRRRASQASGCSRTGNRRRVDGARR